MRYFTTNQIRASLLLCLLAASGWGARYWIAHNRQAGPIPFEPYHAGLAAFAQVDSIRGALAAPVDINTAGAEELQRLSGIGPEMAGRIIRERVRGGDFSDIDELARRVRGIGPVTAERIRDRITFSGDEPPATETDR